ncbi:MAG: class II fructose-bisphosphate aldolase [bacterium]|nr:class II fructose-bisphosphate aldolase [bacterium]
MQPLRERIRDAEAKKVAIGHFNISNLEQLKAVAHAAMRLDVPVIIGVSEGERAYLGLHHVKDFVASYNAEHAKEHGFRLYLNADHTHDPGKVREAARVGFDAVLFDGGKLPFAENVALTRTAATLAREVQPNVLVEGELGYIGSGSQVLEKIPEGAAVTPVQMTTPEEAARFVKETGVDLLAPAVGNVHGLVEGGNPKLNIDRIREIKKAVNIPLVLHGGSGVSDEDFRAAIEAGISIIHISTELRLAWREGIAESLRANPNEVAPYKLTELALAKMERVAESRLRLFNRI